MNKFKFEYRRYFKIQKPKIKYLPNFNYFIINFKPVMSKGEYWQKY